jgi:hypothetical protein
MHVNWFPLPSGANSRGQRSHLTGFSMSRTSFCIRRWSMLTGIVAAWLSAAVVGCDHRQSTAERIERAYQDLGLKPVATYPFAGKVTVDTEPPVAKSERSAFVVVAYDTVKPDAPAGSNAFVFLRPNGSFEFPGLPPGKYVLLFADLEYTMKRGFYGTDALHNLYNDPDFNGKKPQFVIEHQAPGKTDYEFNLTVAGETPPAAPGAKALVGVSRRGRGGISSLPENR